MIKIKVLFDKILRKLISLTTEANAAPKVIGSTSVTNTNSETFTFPQITGGTYGIFFIESSNVNYRGAYHFFNSGASTTFAVTAIQAPSSTNFGYSTGNNSITFTNGGTTGYYVYCLQLNNRTTDNLPTVS